MNVKRGFMLALVLLGLALPLSSVLGNVPSIPVVEITADGDDTLLNVEISHSSPSSSHYVDSVEVKVDNGDATAYEQDPQSSTRFTVELVLEGASPSKVEVRSHCTSHGWSAWKVLVLGEVGDEPEENGGEIPGFPAWSLALGLGVGLLLLWATRKS